MPTVLSPVPPRLAGLLGSLLLTTLPGGPYLLPATLQPMLLIILSGEILLEQPDGSSQRLSRLGLSGATTGIRRASATPGTQILLAAVLPGQLPRLLGLPASAIIEEFVPLDDLLPRPLLAEFSDNLAASATPNEQLTHCTDFLLALQAMQARRAADDPALWPYRLSARQVSRLFGTLAF